MPKYSLKTSLWRKPNLGAWAHKVLWLRTFIRFMADRDGLKTADVRWSVKVIKMKIVYIFPSASINKTAVELECASVYHFGILTASQPPRLAS